MKKRATAILLVSFLFGLLWVPVATAQDMPAPSKHRNVDWYTVSYNKFKPGMADEARDLIYNHFWTVDQKMGRDVIPFDCVTGEWDHIVYFRMKEGPAEIAWSMSPSDAEWMAALAEQEGGMGAAQGLLDRFNELIAHTKTEIVRRPMGGRGVRLGEAIAVREFELQEGVDPEEFERFVVEEHLPGWTKHVPGAEYVIMKGDRGVRDGEYVGIFNFDTVDRRNYYFPTEDAESYPEMDEAAAEILSVRQKYADFATTASSYTDYVLVGAEHFNRFPTIQVLGIHNIRVKPRMEEAFEKFVEEKLSKLDLNGHYVFVYKGDRGQNKNGYIYVAAFDPAYMRDAFFARPTVGTRAYEEAIAPYEEIMDEFQTYVRDTLGSEGTYTDYVIVQ